MGSGGKSISKVVWQSGSQKGTITPFFMLSSSPFPGQTILLPAPNPCKSGESQEEWAKKILICPLLVLSHFSILFKLFPS